MPARHFGLSKLSNPKFCRSSSASSLKRSSSETSLIRAASLSSLSKAPMNSSRSKSSGKDARSMTNLPRKRVVALNKGFTYPSPYYPKAIERSTSSNFSRRNALVTPKSPRAASKSPRDLVFNRSPRSSGSKSPAAIASVARSPRIVSSFAKISGVSTSKTPRSRSVTLEKSRVPSASEAPKRVTRFGRHTPTLSGVGRLSTRTARVSGPELPLAPPSNPRPSSSFSTHKVRAKCTSSAQLQCRFSLTQNAPVLLRSGQKWHGAKFLKSSVLRDNYCVLEKLPNLHSEQAVIAVELQTLFESVTVLCPAVIVSNPAEKRTSNYYPILTGTIKSPLIIPIDELSSISDVDLTNRRVSFSYDRPATDMETSSASFMSNIRGVLKDTSRSRADDVTYKNKTVAFRSPIQSAREASFDESMSTLIDGSSAESRELSFLACQLENANMLNSQPCRRFLNNQMLKNRQFQTWTPLNFQPVNGIKRRTSLVADIPTSPNDLSVEAVPPYFLGRRKIVPKKAPKSLKTPDNDIFSTDSNCSNLRRSSYSINSNRSVKDVASNVEMRRSGSLNRLDKDLTNWGRADLGVMGVKLSQYGDMPAYLDPPQISNPFRGFTFLLQTLLSL